MKRALVIALVGAGNLGDEAVFAATRQLLRERGFDEQVLSYSPSDTLERHGVAAARALSRDGFVGALPALVKAIRSADLVVLGGGGLLQDLHRPLAVPLWLAPIWLAQQLGRPTAVFCVGAGPIQRHRSRELLRRVLDHCELVSVRDEESARYLAEEVGYRGALALGADPVFALALAVNSSRGHPTERPVIALGVRSWPGWDASRVASVCDLLVAELDASIRMVAMEVRPELGSPRCDHAFSEAVRAICQNPERISVPDAHLTLGAVVERIAGASIAIGMRLHFLLLSVRLGVPPVCIAYDRKVTELARILALEVMPLTTSPEEVLIAARNALTRRAQLGFDRSEQLSRLERRCNSVADSLRDVSVSELTETSPRSIAALFLRDFLSGRRRASTSTPPRGAVGIKSTRCASKRNGVAGYDTARDVAPRPS